MKEMTWNVYVEDFNANDIKIFNVFNHYRFRQEVGELLKKYKDKDKFTEELKHTTMYYFWSKAEWEIVITEWVPHINNKELERLNKDSEEFEQKYNKIPCTHFVNLDAGIKVDVYDQLKLNWNEFVDYIWDSKTHRPRKTYGSWEYDPNGIDWGLGAWRCSKCHARNSNLGATEDINPYLYEGSKFCPNCGIPMKKT